MSPLSTKSIFNIKISNSKRRYQPLPSLCGCKFFHKFFAFSSLLWMVFKWNKTLSQIYGHRKQMAFRFCVDSSLHTHDGNTMGHETSWRQLQIHISFLYSDPENNLKGLLSRKIIHWRISFEECTQNKCKNKFISTYRNSE